MIWRAPLCGNTPNRQSLLSSAQRTAIAGPAGSATADSNNQMRNHATFLAPQNARSQHNTPLIARGRFRMADGRVLDGLAFAKKTTAAKQIAFSEHN
jgi:hypothetical protein